MSEDLTKSLVVPKDHSGDSLPDYSFDQKERLARRIQKLKKQKYLVDIENIIIKHNPDLYITTTPSGKLMYFQDLRKDTYYALEKYVRKILKLKTLSETSENAQYSSEMVKYSEDDDMFPNNSKLKYSNKERNLIKRKIYDKQVNQPAGEQDNQNDQDDDLGSDVLSDLVSSSHEPDKTKSPANELPQKAIPEKVSNNNVFVKRKTTTKVSKNADFE